MPYRIRQRIHMDEDTRAVSEGLEQALADSGLTRAEFAAALGTSASCLSTYRSGSERDLVTA
jgi:hypothetical protein